MSDTLAGLLNTIEDAQLRSVQFFNGRLLSAADLTREQESARERLRRLGRALGPGVLEGLELSWGGAANLQELTLSAGAAITPAGELITLASEVRLDWAGVGAALKGPMVAGEGTFGPCDASEDPQPQSGHLFALVAAPTTTPHGRAPGAAVLRSAETCGVDHHRDAVALSLRFLPLPDELRGVDPKALRSMIAYALLEGDATYSWSPSYRANADEPEPVPLALIWAEGATIQWVDPWAVRRLSEPAAASVLPDLLDGPAPRVGLARLMQQREHLAALSAATSTDEAESANGSDDALSWLAPGGLLPSGDLSLIRPWLTGGRSGLPEPAFETVPAGLILHALRRTLGLAALRRPDPESGDLRPAIALLRWEQTRAWAQSERAQLEIVFSEAEIEDEAWADTEITLSAPNGASWRQTGSAGQRVFLLTDLPGGVGFTLEVSNPALRPIQARTVGLVVGLVKLARYEVEALPSVSEAPHRWIDLDLTAGKERWYLAVAYARDATAAAASASTTSSTSRTLSSALSARSSSIRRSSGIRNATEMFSPDTGNYTTWADLPAALQAWLLRWQRQLASLCEDRVQAAAILRSTPKVLERKITHRDTLTPVGEVIGERSHSSQGALRLVSFGSLTLPLRVVEAKQMTPKPVPLDSGWMNRLQESEFSALAAIGLEYIDELTGASDAELSAICEDREDLIRGLRAYAEDVVAEILALLGKDEESLSAADRLSAQKLRSG